MPTSIIKINNSDELQWYVGDSRMEELIKLLNKLGSKIQIKINK